MKIAEILNLKVKAKYPKGWIKFTKPYNPSAKEMGLPFLTGKLKDNRNPPTEDGNFLVGEIKKGQKIDFQPAEYIESEWQPRYSWSIQHEDFEDTQYIELSYLQNRKLEEAIEEAGLSDSNDIVFKTKKVALDGGKSTYGFEVFGGKTEEQKKEDPKIEEEYSAEDLPF